jgi:phosphoheptose isomerase
MRSKLWRVVPFLLVLSPFLLLLGHNDVKAAFPRAYGNYGAASTSNTAIALPFNPAHLCIANDDAAIVIYVNFVTGVGVNLSGVSNIAIKGASEKCWEFRQANNANDLVTVGILAASGTPAYRLEATR